VRNEVGGNVHGQVVQAGHVGRISLHSASRPLTALSGLPPATTVFYGRVEEIAALRAAWSSDGPAVVSSAVAGLAGIGKTELVLRAAHQALTDGEFPGGALFVDLQGYDPERRVAPGQALDSFLRALGVDGQSIPPSEDQRATLFRSMLSGRSPVLILLDNASSTAQVRPLLPGGRHKVVITSRHTLTGLDEARHLDLGVLDSAEATGLVGDPRLAALCGHLPLALRIMRALAASDPRTDWTAELTDARHRLELLDDGDSRAVHAAFDLSYRSLDPELCRLFRLLSLHPTDEFSLEGAAVLADRPVNRTRALLRELVRAHLVELGATPDWFTFHDLVRLYAHRCAEGDPESDAAVERMLMHYGAKAEAAMQHLAPRFNAGETFFKDRQEAATWLDRTWRVLVAAVRSPAVPHRALFQLVEGLYAYFDTYRHSDELLAICQLALRAARGADDRCNEARMLTALGNAYVRTRQHEIGITCLEKSLELNRSLGEDFHIAVALNDVGTAYRKASCLGAAHDAYTEALGIREAIADQYGLGQTLNNLGNTLRDKGDRVRAMEFYLRALDIRQQTGDRHGTAQVLNNLATAHALAGDNPQALAHYLDALALYREVGHEFRQAGTLYLLGGIYLDTDPGEALTAWREALSIYERLGAEQEAQDVRDRLTHLHDSR
jgi:tetratricopeptide (TPR) repeat protein